MIYHNPQLSHPVQSHPHLASNTQAPHASSPKRFGLYRLAQTHIRATQNVLAKTSEVLVYLKQDADVIALDEIIAGCGKS